MNLDRVQIARMKIEKDDVVIVSIPKHWTQAQIDDVNQFFQQLCKQRSASVLTVLGEGIDVVSMNKTDAQWLAREILSKTSVETNQPKRSIEID